MRMAWKLCLCGWLLVPTTLAGQPLEEQPGVVGAEFIFQEAPFPQCHASTLAQARNVLVAAWFGGTRERHPDVGIWVSRRTDNGWTKPVEVADGKQDAKTRYPCWNPVLFAAADGRLQLFYKVGPSPRSWWGMLIESHDAGKTWSAPVRLPEGIAGPIKNKPVLLDGGKLLCGSSTEDEGWRVHFEWTTDGGRTWQRTDPINDGSRWSIIQPTILTHSPERLQALCRSRQGRIVTTWSDDAGKSWSAPEATKLPNPNSGIDAVTLADGRHLLIYNHTQRGRSPLNVALSQDGKSWHPVLVLENQPGEYSYPAVIQADDGNVHITYTWRRRRVRHWVVNLSELKPLDR